MRTKEKPAFLTANGVTLMYVHMYVHVYVHPEKKKPEKTSGCTHSCIVYFTGNVLFLIVVFV